MINHFIEKDVIETKDQGFSEIFVSLVFQRKKIHKRA